jgi:hypothetical protein
MVERTRFNVPEKPKHSLGWDCQNCFHVVKDTQSKAMKCSRNPPSAQMVMLGNSQACVSVSPPVQVGEWCGEFTPHPHAANV